MLKANSSSIHSIFEKLKRGRFLEYKAAISWATQLFPEIREKEAIQAYVFSKMHVEDEMENNAQYFQMAYVEFIEFLVRLAEMWI